MNQKEYVEDYTLAELMCVAAARELKDGETVFLGLGLPLLAGTLAKLLHTPHAQLFTEVGVFDWAPDLELINRAPIHIADLPLFVRPAMLGDMADHLGLMLMGGNQDVAFLGAAQVDCFGNLNTICLGDYHRPTRRLPGVGGNTEAACLAKRTITILPQERRRFVEKVDFRTSPGYIDGPGGRTRAGLKTQGPNVVISTMGVFRFDTPDGGGSGSCEMYLDAVFPNVSPSTIKELTSWGLKVTAELKEVEPPTVEEVLLLRRLDSLGMFLAEGRY